MRITRVLLSLTLVAAGVALSAGANPVAAAAAVTTRPIRVMPLGDSITYGQGSPTLSSYRAALWQRLVGQAGYAIDFVGSQHNGALPDVDNEGHSGWRIDNIAGSVNGWLATYQPDVVLLHIGTNDMNQNYQVATAPDRLGALIDQILAARPAARVVVAKIIPALDPTIQSRINAFNAAVPAVVAARGARASLVDLSPLVATDLNDTLHPNDTGYAKMAARWYSGLVPVLGDGRDWPSFTSGTESGEPAPNFTDSIVAAVNVGGYCCALTAMEASPRSEGIAHSGASAIMYSGLDQSATQSYSYAQLYETHLVVAGQTVLSYWIYPQQSNGTHAAVDLRLTDGGNLRDSGAVDQYGVRAHPRFQGDGGHLIVGQWNLVRVNLGGLAGRTIDRIHLGYDQPAATGQFRGYVDDIRIADEQSPWPGVDLALNRPTTGSTACVAAEAASRATDGVVAGNSKWCGAAAPRFLQVDLGASHQIRRVVIRHASAGGEALALNTSAFNLQVSTDGANWTTAATVTANADGVSTHPVTATARWVRLNVVTPTQTSDPAARVYELEVYGT
jgi:lysophospholipase L1-like esterase